MEAIGMLVMPEFFTYRSLQRMTDGCKDMAILGGSVLLGAVLTQVCLAAAVRKALVWLLLLKSIEHHFLVEG